MSVELASKYLMRALTVKRTRLKAIEERASQGICIMDNCGCPSYSRGLCQSHYNAFDYELRNQPSDETKLAFEEQNIVDGNVLPKGKQRRYTRKSPFSQVS